MDRELKCYQGTQETCHGTIKGFLGKCPGPGCCSCPSPPGLPCTGTRSAHVPGTGQLMPL